jgi:steroid delta-isomerase-like uncharacterized protein
MGAGVEEMLRRYYAAWGTADPDAVVRFFTEDAVFEDLAFAARFDGAAGIRQFAMLTYSGVPDFRVEPEAIVAGAGGRAAAAWVMSGTHRGDFPGLPATNRAFRVRASSILEIAADGRIARMTDYWSPDDFRREVGLLPL